MVKVKGVNIYPGQIDDLLKEVDGASSEYQVMIDHLNGKDIMTLFFETEAGVDKARIANNVQAYFKMRIGVTIVPKPVARIFDNRY